MKRLCLLLVLGATLVPALAVDFQFVGGSDVVFYNMDFQSIVSVNSYRKAWVRINHLQVAKTDDYPAKEYQSEMMLYYFDCAGKMLVATQSVLYAKYGGEGDVVRSKSIKFNPQSLDDVVPGSVGEAMLNVACATAAERSKIKARNEREIQEFTKAAKVQ